MRITSSGVIVAIAWSTLAAAFGGVAGDCPDCRSDGGKTSLCAPHREEESRVLKDAAKARYRDPPDARIAALESIARLVDAHANAPSPDAAKALAIGLKDDSYSIRRKAVELLLHGQHPETVVTALIVAQNEANRDWKEIDGFFARWAEVHGKPGANKWDSKENETFSRDMSAPGYIQALLKALGKLPDDRSEKALLEYLRCPLEKTPAIFLGSACDAALELRSRKSVGRVAELLPQLATAIRSGKLSRRYAPVNPRILGGLILETLDPASEHTYESIAAAAIELAKSIDASDVPDKAIGAATAWPAWFAAHSGRFAESLGTIARPVVASLGDPPPAVPGIPSPGK